MFEPKPWYPFDVYFQDDSVVRVNAPDERTAKRKAWAKTEPRGAKRPLIVRAERVVAVFVDGRVA